MYIFGNEAQVEVASFQNKIPQKSIENKIHKILNDCILSLRDATKSELGTTGLEDARV